MTRKAAIIMRNLLIILIPLLAFTQIVNAAVTVQEAAIPFVWPANAPRPDDVTMRTLWFRPIDKEDPENTFRALDAFHATRLEWTYLRAYEHNGRFMVESDLEPEDPEELLAREVSLIEKVKATGRVFGGASNASTGTDVVWHGWQEATKKHTIVDISGEPLIGGHMKNWAAPQSPGCANNPHYLQGYVEYVKHYIQAGAETIQRDEPSGNHSYAEARLGCYCTYCLDGFKDYLFALSVEELTGLGIDDPERFNYRDYVIAKGAGADSTADFDWSDPGSLKAILSNDPVSRLFIDFQAKSQADFFDIVRMRVNEFVGHSFPFSCNNTSFQRFDPEMYHGFDFYMSELMMQSANPSHIYNRAKEARARGKVQVFGTPKTMGKHFDEDFLVDLKRKVIATTYATGALSRVPWDIFQQTSDGTGRYFGKPSDYADLYGMVRASSRFLEGYCDSGAIGPGLNSLQVYGEKPPIHIDGSAEETFAFIRARPEDTIAPVVIHLVDWGKQPAAFSIRVSKDAVFPSKSLKAVLRIPGEYNAEEHREAEIRAQEIRRPDEKLGSSQSNAYESLVTSINLEVHGEGNDWVLDLPSLHPWGILVLEID